MDDDPAQHQAADANLRRATLTTNSADELTRALEGQPVEMAERGPRQLSNGQFSVEIVAELKVLRRLPVQPGRLNIHESQEVLPIGEGVSQENRYAEKERIPHGLGEKIQIPKPN